MAKIPIINPGDTQISTISANVPMTRIGTSGKSLQVAGQTIEKIADERYRVMDEARNFTEASQAELFTTQKHADLLIKADTDTYTTPDGKVRLKTGKKEDFAIYDEEIRKSREDVTKFFSNKEQQNKFLAEYDKSAIVIRNAIQNKFMKNVISEGQATILEAVDGLSNAYAVSSDELILKEIETKINEAETKGFYTADDAYKLKIKAKNDAKEKAFNYDLQTNPALAEKKLAENTYGFDIEKLKSSGEVFDREIKRIQNQNEESVTDSYIKAELSEDEVIALRDKKQIGADFAKSMIGALNSIKRIGAKTVDSTFIKITENMIDITKKPEDIKLGLLQKNATGEISDEDFEILNTFNKTINTEIVDKAMVVSQKIKEMDKTKPTSQKTWLERLFYDISRDKGLRQEVIADMFKQYMQKVNTGIEPAQAVSEVTNTALDIHLSEQLKYPNRHYGINPETKQRIYSDDGGATWIDEKGKVIK